MHSINRYAEMREQTSRVGERPLIALPKIPNELELQARWFAGEFGRKFRTLAGESVEIVQFGFFVLRIAGILPAAAGMLPAAVQARLFKAVGPVRCNALRGTH